MTEFNWQAEWDLEFSKRIAEEAVNSDVPPSQWIASGKRTKARPHGEGRDFWSEMGPQWSANWAEFREAQRNWDLWYTPDGKPGIELPCEFNAGGITVKAIPDRVYQTPYGLAIVDLKAGARKPDAGYQLPIYQLALDVVYGIPGEQIDGFYYMNRSGELIPDYSPVQYNRERLEGVFATAVAQIKAGNFLPNPGSSCARCDVKERCEIVGGKL